MFAGVFNELHAQHVFGSDGGYFLVRHLNAVDAGLHGSAAADAHAVAQVVHLQAGDAEIVQQVVGAERAFQLALGGQDNLTVHPLKHVAGGYGHFTQTDSVFLQLHVAQVEVVVQFQQDDFTLIADESNGQAVIARLDFIEGKLTLCIRSYSGHQGGVRGP